MKCNGWNLEYNRNCDLTRVYVQWNEKPIMKKFEWKEERSKHHNILLIFHEDTEQSRNLIR